MTNTYSEIWFQLFLETQPYTQQETDFIIRHLPNPPYSRILDLCCGQGRHAALLADVGYEVIGEEICEIAAGFGLHCCLLCTDYNEQQSATSTKPRMQLIFERRD